MSECNQLREEQGWNSQDPRLLRAAQRIIRLYDLEQAGLITVRAESVADIIAHELNDEARENHP
jgi:hypothetical protein